MSILDKIKDIVSVPEDDYDDMPEEVNFPKRDPEEYRDRDRDVRSSASSSSSSSSGYGSSNYSSSYDTDRYDKPRSKVVKIPATTQLKVVLVKPERFDDAPAIADHLNAKRTVVLNLEAANKDTARRLIDFLSGVAYANQGQLKRVANSTFIITPFDVDLMGDSILDELESNNMYI